MIRVAINGFGRIGRELFREIVEDEKFEIVAINDLVADTEQLAHLLSYEQKDHTHEISFTKESIIYDQKIIPVLNSIEFAKMNCKDYDIDILLECMKTPANEVRLNDYLKAGIKKVLTFNGIDVSVLKEELITKSLEYKLENIDIKPTGLIKKIKDNPKETYKLYKEKVKTNSNSKQLIKRYRGNRKCF